MTVYYGGVGLRERVGTNDVTRHRTYFDTHNKHFFDLLIGLGSNLGKSFFFHHELAGQLRFCLAHTRTGG